MTKKKVKVAVEEVDEEVFDMAGFNRFLKSTLRHCDTEGMELKRIGILRESLLKNYEIVRK